MGTYIIRDVQDFLIERWGQKQMRSDVDLQLAAHAKQVRLENAQLREQNRVLEGERDRLKVERDKANRVLETVTQHVGTLREAMEDIQDMAEHCVSEQLIIRKVRAALTATSQEG